MGYAGYGYRQFNLPHKVEMGWVPTLRIQTVTADGTYIISRLEDNINPGEPQVLKIFKADSNEYYYLGYRSPIGYDLNLQNQYKDQTNVHRWGGVGGTFTYSLDALADLESFADQTNGITITQKSHDISRSYVSVSFTVFNVVFPVLVTSTETFEDSLVLMISFSSRGWLYLNVV